MGAYGCSSLGAGVIKTGRGVYNEAITRTDAQQMLMKIVRNRYGEASSMLAVTSVTANVRVAARADINVGVGALESYAANLIPFSGGVMYEENPTISYSTVESKQYMKDLLSPIELELVVLLFRSMLWPGPYFTLLVSGVNDLENPDFLRSPTAKYDPRFMRFVEVMTKLSNSDVLHWVQDKRKEVAFAILIHKYAPAHQEEVGEFLDLLGLPEPADKSKNIVLPVFLAADKPELGGIAMETRSIWDLAEILTASVEVPEEDIRSGVTQKYPRKGLAGKDLHIHYSTESPDAALVAVKYRGAWFYIDETDSPTKMAFRVFQKFQAMMIAEVTARDQRAPILTVPVSR